MTLLDMAQDLQMKASGDTIFDALDTYYHDDVEIVEGNGDTFHGKDTQRGRIQEWMQSVEDIHDGGIRSLAANETSPGTGVVFAETYTDATFKGSGRWTMEEVAVQQWKDGKVVHERFYYNVPEGSM